MKKNPLFSISLCMVALFVALQQCKKNQSRLNIMLYDQPLPVIQKYVSGKWKLEYTYGGYVANLRTNFHDKDYIWQINNGLSIKQTVMENLVTDASIEWYPESRYTNVGTTFIMKFYDIRMYPYNYIVWGIVDDSLVLRDFGSDAAIYHFSKQN